MNFELIQCVKGLSDDKVKLLLMCCGNSPSNLSSDLKDYVTGDIVLQPVNEPPDDNSISGSEWAVDSVEESIRIHLESEMTPTAEEIAEREFVKRRRKEEEEFRQEQIERKLVEKPTEKPEVSLNNSPASSSNDSTNRTDSNDSTKPKPQLSTHPVAILRRAQYENNKKNPEWMKKKAESAKKYRDAKRNSKLPEPTE